MLWPLFLMHSLIFINPLGPSATACLTGCLPIASYLAIGGLFLTSIILYIIYKIEKDNNQCH